MKSIFRTLFLLAFLLPSFAGYSQCNPTFISSSGQVCTGQTVTYSTNDPFDPTLTYFWTVTSGGSIITGQGTNSIDVSWTGPGGTESVTLDISRVVPACNASFPMVFTLGTTPPTPTITPGGPTTFCTGGSVVLTSSSASGNLWSVFSTGQTINVTTSGSYSVLVVAAGCTSAVSNVVIVTVNPVPPTPTITPQGPTTFCAGGSVTLTSSSAGGNYWSPSPAGLGPQNIVVSTSGIYQVYSASGGCTTAVSMPVVVTVNPIPPTPSINPPGPISLCTGGSVLLASSTSAGNLWSPSGSLTQTITVTTTTSVTLETIALGCTSNASIPVVVTVNPIPPTPIITPMGPTTFCQGDSVWLSSSPGASYLWSPGGSTSQNFRVTISGSFTVTVTSSNCSSTSVPMTVTVLPNLSVSLGPDQTVCSFPINLTANASLGSPPYTYNWGCALTGQIGQTAPMNAPGTACVTVSDQNGCIGRDTVVISQAAPINPVITPTGSLSFCPGGSVILCCTGTGLLTFLWSNSTTSSCLTTSSGGLISCTVTDVNGCTASASVTTIVYPAPTPGISLAPVSPYCSDDTVVMSCTGGPFSVYNWSTVSTNSSDSLLYPGNNSPVSITLTVTDANTCTASASSTVQFENDCVFPGDANYDLLANNLDVLEIAAAIGQTGPLRSGGTTSWIGQDCPNWSTTLPSGANSKHGDCDADGNIALADTLAVTQNYGLTHFKTHTTTGGFTLHVTANQTQYGPGDTIRLILSLSEPGNPVPSFYGLAFSLGFDPSMLDPLYHDISYSSVTGLGSRFSQYMTWSLLPQNGRLDMVVSRMNGIPLSFEGTLAEVFFILSDSLNLPHAIPASFVTQNIQMLDGNGVYQPLSGDSAVVDYTDSPTSINPEKNSALQIFPNPSSESVKIKLEKGNATSLEVFNLSGQQVLRKNISNANLITLDCSGFVPGIYLLKIRDEYEGVITGKLMVE